MSVSLAKSSVSTRRSTVPMPIHTGMNQVMVAMADVLANNHLESFQSILRAQSMGVVAMREYVSLEKAPVEYETRDREFPVVFKNGKSDWRRADQLRNNNLCALSEFYSDAMNGVAEIL